MRFYLSALLIGLFSVSASAQVVSTILLNKFQHPCTPEEAFYYRQVYSPKNQLYLVEDYTLADSLLYERGWMKIDFYNDAITVSDSIKASGEEILQSALIRNYNDAKYISHGITERFYKNGIRKSVRKYVENEPQGPFQLWYESGAPQGDFYYLKRNEYGHDFMVINFYDSLNQQLVKDSVGTYYESDRLSSGQGPIKKGLKNGNWTGYFKNGKSTYNEQYVDGKLIEAFSTDSAGITYSYNVLFEQPQYKGGMYSFYKNVRKQMTYPKAARKMGIEGRVYVEFVVNSKGDVTQVSVVKGIGELCDAEACRALSNIKGFIPGKYKGQFASVKMVLPIIFSLH